MIIVSSKNKLTDLFYIADRKFVKADESGLKLQAKKFSQARDYIEDAISEEFNIEWNDYEYYR